LLFLSENNQNNRTPWCSGSPAELIRSDVKYKIIAAEICVFVSFGGYILLNIFFDYFLTTFKVDFKGN